MLLSGRTIGAAEALQIGLVEYVFPDEDLLPETLALARAIASNPASAVAATKECVNTGLRMGWEAGLAKERELRVQTGRGYDAAEGRNAFLEKRAPRFNQEGQ